MLGIMPIRFITRHVTQLLARRISQQPGLLISGGILPETGIEKWEDDRGLPMS
jgi:hypothetical protein